MIVLRFVGRDAESDALLFADDEGRRYTAALSDSLTSAVLRGPVLEVVDSQRSQPPSPRHIQALLREGFSASQVAEQTGTDIDRVRRFEGPVRAEIARAISATQNSSVGTDREAPTIGDLVVDRLAERLVDTTALDWRAAKRGPTWEVTVVFVEGDVEKSATWSLSDSGNLAQASNDEARTLTETVRTAEPVRALFPPVASASAEVFDVEAEDLLERQEQLLKRLNAARGRRQPVMMGFEGDEPDTVPLSPIPSPTNPTQTPGSADTTSEQPTSDSDDVIDESSGQEDGGHLEEDGEDPTPTMAPQPSEPHRRRGRTPVPSWDEIVFGSRTD